MADDLLKVRYGTSTQLPVTRDDNTLYFVTDTKQIYKGADKFTSQVESINIASTAESDIRVLWITQKNGDELTANILSQTALDAVLSVINGLATDTTKGLVTLSDSIKSSSDVKEGVAATPNAVRLAVEEAKNYTDEQIVAGIAANDAMVLKGIVGLSGGKFIIQSSSDSTLESKELSTITNYSAGWTFKVSNSATFNDQMVESGDMIIAVKDYNAATGNVASDWSIIQSNIQGAVTQAEEDFGTDKLMISAGASKVKSLSKGNNGQVVTMVNGKPTWSDLPTEENTTYTFTNGTDGSFTVTPSGGSAQKVTIGKPATAGTADVALKGRVGSTDVTFGEAAGKGVSTTIANNQNLITAAAVNSWKTNVDSNFNELYDALTWKSFATA